MDIEGRDRGLRKLSTLTRWSVGGAVALTGAFAALAAHARPGTTRSSSTDVTTVPSPGQDFLQPPAQSPRAGRGGGFVRSGAS